MALRSRRDVLLRTGLGAFALAVGRAAAQDGGTAAAPDARAKVVEDLVAANRILADQGVLDAYGHVSARAPQNAGRFLMSRSLAPEMVTAADVLEHDLDGNVIAPAGANPFLERFIHAGIYRARPDVNAVVHCHSPSLIPFGATGAPLRPLYHMSAFLRGHGAVVVAADLPQAVFRSVYTELNARLQAQAISLGGTVTYLDDEEARKAEATMGSTVQRPWELWRRKAMGK
jgi:ribulose-5-phosphate 4-epimerase/fuculose-1-phosphate aldolase